MNDEKRFQIIHLGNPYDFVVKDRQTNRTYGTFQGDEKSMEDMLNNIYKENQELRLQLNQCSDQRNEFHRGARKNANRVGKLKEENEQLQKSLSASVEKNRKLQTILDKLGYTYVGDLK